jgi:hypothetical protein
MRSRLPQQIDFPRFHLVVFSAKDPVHHIATRGAHIAIKRNVNLKNYFPHTNTYANRGEVKGLLE